MIRKAIIIGAVGTAKVEFVGKDSGESKFTSYLLSTIKELK